MLSDDAGRNAATLTIMRLPKKLPHKGHTGSDPHPEVPRRGLEGRGLRAQGRVRGGCFEGRFAPTSA